MCEATIQIQTYKHTCFGDSIKLYTSLSDFDLVHIVL